jgi:hypothetical protein
MSGKKTLIFLIILLLLGGYYYIVEVRIAEKKRAAEEAEKKLFQFKEEEIQEISVKRIDQEIVLKKQDSVWKMIQPVTASTDAQNVKNMITSFVDAERDKTITEKSSGDQEFGLDNPEIVVTLKTQKGDTGLQLSIGRETPTASGYYARVGENPTVITISTSVKTNLDKTMYDLRDKTILAFEPAQVKQAVFTVKNSETGVTQEIKLAQTNDLWKIVAPKEYNADKAKMVSLLSKVKNSSIKEFIEENPENLAQYGLDQPTNTLSLLIGDDNTQKTLLLGNTDQTKKGVYAKYEAARNVFLVPMDLAEEFPKKLNDLRDRTLLAFNDNGIQKIELRSSAETVVLERILSATEEKGKQEEQWKISQPGEFKADSSKVRELLSDAKDLKIEQFISDEPGDLSPYGLNPPQITLNLWEKDQANPRQLLLGNSDVKKTGIYAKLGDQDSLVLVKPDVLEQFKKTAFDLRYKKILSFTPNQVEKIQIKYPETILVLEKDGDIWRATEPEKKELVSYKINNLMYDLEDLEFTEEILTPEKDLRIYGLQEPQGQLTLWEKGGKEVFTLLIGKKQEGKEVLYAKTVTANTIYAIEPSFLDELPKEIEDLAK